MASAVAAISLAMPIVASAPVNSSSAKNSNGLKQVQGLSLYSPNKLSSSRLVGYGKNRVVMMAKNDSERGHSMSAGLPALALAAAMVIPEMAEAAVPGVSPSLKNFLLSIASGSVVASAIGVAVIGVSSFDPVKRN